MSVTARIGLLLAAGLPPFASAGLTPVLPAIAAHFADYPNIGVLTRLMVSIIGVAIIIGSPAMGILADRYGRRAVLLAGLVLYAVAGCAGFVFNNPYEILATRVVVGFATAALGTMTLAIVASQSSGQARNRWLGYLNTAAAICALVLIPLSGFAGNFGWHWAFLVYAVASPLCALVYMGLPPDRPIFSECAPASKQSLNIRELPWSLLVFAVACGIVTMTAGMYFPFHLSDIGFGDPRQISLAIVILSTATMASSFFYGAIRSRLSLNATFVVGFGLSAASLILIAATKSYAGVLFGQVMGGVGFALVAISLYARAAQTGSDVHRARTMGVAKGGLYAGPLVGQLILEPLVGHAGNDAPLFAIAALALVISVLYAARLRETALQT